LAKVQKKPIHSSLAEKRDLLLSLSGAKEGHIKRLLNLPESGNLSPQDTPIPLESLTGSLIRHLAPHRQAVSASECDEYFRLNLISVLILNGLFVKNFTKTEKTVVNISSLCAVQPFPSFSLYCTGKAARDMFFKVNIDILLHCVLSNNLKLT